MKYYATGALLVLFSMLTGCSNLPELEYLPPYSYSSYTLGAGDELRIVVLPKVEQVDQPTDYIIDASGKLSMPLGGSFRASGRTTAQLEASIRSVLKRRDLVKDPQVSVQVTTYRPYYVLGEVGQAGKYSYVPGTTVLAAVATAGGYTIYADQGPVLVTRKVSGHEEVGYLAPLDPIAPGDTIHVQERYY